MENETQENSNRFALRSKNVVMPHKVDAATVIINNGRITGFLGYDMPVSVPLIDVGEHVIMPGGIDIHVHLNDPGRDWEGFASGTKSAVAGGITTVVDMPLNSDPVTTTMSALEAKQQAMTDQLWSNCALHAGVTPASLPHLAGLLQAGCVAGKAFMVNSGINDFALADRETLREGMKILAEYGRPLLAHAELDLGESAPDGDPRKFETYLASRPPAWEVKAIEMLIELCRETGCTVHVVHLATAEALPLLRAARDEGLPITVETCPHYLHFTAEQIPDGATAYKCAPPIRSRETREQLWDALLAGDIDLVASDHSPCSPDLKLLDQGDFLTAWGGISGLQLTLPVMYTQLRERIDDPSLVWQLLTTWMTENPAALLGMSDQVGRIWRGQRADLVIWDPNASFVVQGEKLHHRHKLTPYEGETLYGVVQQTYVNGRLAYDINRSDQDLFGEPHGQAQYAK